MSDTKKLIKCFREIANPQKLRTMGTITPRHLTEACDVIEELQSTISAQAKEIDRLMQELNAKAWDDRTDKLQVENKTLRVITEIKDPEQHFEQIMSANKHLQAKIKGLKKQYNILFSQNDSLQRRCNKQQARITELEGAAKEANGLLGDINSRINEILYHHAMPKKSRHGNTTRTCEDIKSRINTARQALSPPKTEGKPKCFTCGDSGEVREGNNVSGILLVTPCPKCKDKLNFTVYDPPKGL